MIKRLHLASVVIFVPVLVASVGAQTPGPPAGGSDRNLRDSASDLKIRSNEMERLKRDAEKPEARTNPSPNFLEIKEDFEGMQKVNADVQVNGSSATPNYELISKGVAEINKRATRLKGNLFTSQPAKKPKENKQGNQQSELKQENKQANQQLELKPLLIALDNSIVRFVQSPIFQNVKLVNSDDSKKAQEDLEKIIKLSSVIVVEADRLKTSSP
jgi:hypothetical protein